MAVDTVLSTETTGAVSGDAATSFHADGHRTPLTEFGVEQLLLFRLRNSEAHRMCHPVADNRKLQVVQTRRESVSSQSECVAMPSVKAEIVTWIAGRRGR